MSRAYALVEIATYRDVSLGVMRRMAPLLGWSPTKRAVLAAGIYLVYVVERVWSWRRMTTIETPERPGAMDSALPAPG
jgi:hypothetical protein